ncbi:type IVB secretion system protein IcmH/DotU [Pseudomonas vanderleydeniana]|uniref:Type IVB secretion system protein IcmH/DotU n=1 Tax=Pseudomonas vanderleydeniana TaxID=2745495 RepID=A0A9E6PQW8_9PSED|nr:type IVB secretion system protein IcmH/DotU [Pseudomonas vanderleydeniana]QXI30580.1 type IVB secretion system protein IcmH/DotU [Pseudomonas vanderleydeniana]
MNDSQFQLRGLAWNPLCDAAMPLLGLALHVRTLDTHADVPAFYQSIHSQVGTVMEEVRQLDYDLDTLQAYSYALCLLLDETVMSTPWGRSSSWSERSLLGAFHQESWGGEKFFTLLALLSVDPRRYQHALEFMYLCLCLGTRGKYGQLAGGDDEAQKIITRLHGLLRPLRGEVTGQLSEPLANVASRDYRFRRRWPLWTPWAIAGLVSSATYTAYHLHLSAITREVLASLDKLLKL